MEQQQDFHDGLDLEIVLPSSSSLRTESTSCRLLGSRQRRRVCLVRRTTTSASDTATDTASTLSSPSLTMSIPPAEKHVYVDRRVVENDCGCGCGCCDEEGGDDDADGDQANLSAEDTDHGNDNDNHIHKDAVRNELSSVILRLAQRLMHPLPTSTRRRKGGKASLNTDMTSTQTVRSTDDGQYHHDCQNHRDEQQLWLYPKLNIRDGHVDWNYSMLEDYRFCCSTATTTTTTTFLCSSQMKFKKKRGGGGGRAGGSKHIVGNVPFLVTYIASPATTTEYDMHRDSVLSMVAPQTLSMGMMKKKKEKKPKKKQCTNNNGTKIEDGFGVAAQLGKGKNDGEVGVDTSSSHSIVLPPSSSSSSSSFMNLGAMIYSDVSVIQNNTSPISDEMLCIDAALGIYVCESGLSVTDCQAIIQEADAHAKTKGGWSSYTYAKQTLGCRESDRLAFVCAKPVMTACATVRHHLSYDYQEEEEEGEEQSSTPSTYSTTITTGAEDEGCYGIILDNNYDEATTQVSGCGGGEGGERSPSSSGSQSPNKKELVLDIREPHVVKYDTVNAEHRKLGMHTDKSEWTFLIALSMEGNLGQGGDYMGGGTYFQALDLTVHLQRSQMLVFRGKLRHCGVTIQAGCRYLLVGFLVPQSC